MSNTFEAQRKYQVETKANNPISQNTNISSEKPIHMQMNKLNLQNDKGNSTLGTNNSQNKYSQGLDSDNRVATVKQSRENSARNSDDSVTYSNNNRSNRGSILRQSRYGGKSLESGPVSGPQESVSKKPQIDDKKDKISFKNEIQEIKVVENWKEYNNDDYNNTTCHCCTF